jgi:hypothetical protein
MMGRPFQLDSANRVEIQGEEKNIHTKCELSTRFQSPQKKNETHKKHMDSWISDQFLIAGIVDSCDPLE